MINFAVAKPEKVPTNSSSSDHDKKLPSIEHFSYQVSIESEDKSREVCDGSIIAKNWIITSVACIRFIGNESLSVRAGSSVKLEGGTVHKVDKVVEHPEFEYTSSKEHLNDLALMRVVEPFAIEPIPLFKAGEKPLPGKMANLSGFPWTETTHQQDKHFHAIEVSLIDLDRCNKIYFVTGEAGIPKGHLCTDAFVTEMDQRNVSSYNFGGSILAVDGRLAAICTGGLTFFKFPAVCTEISSNRNWIEQYVRF